MRRFLLPIFLLPLIAAATIPSGYYRSVNGLQGAQLKAALQTLLYNHTEVSSYSDLPKYFRITDVYPQGDSRYGQWWDMYGNIPLKSSSFSGLNREHSFPKSWWGGSTDTPAYVDLYHLYPSEAQANMAKSNYPLGEVQTATYDNSVTAVGYPVSGEGGGAQKVFEPADEYKGDFARTYFYFVTTYSNLHWKYTYMVSQNAYPTLNQWSVDLLMRWHRQDSVSQKELDRNEAVYKIQFNRNPFIDFPELAEYLWGTKKMQSFYPDQQGGDVTPPSGPTGPAELITPVANETLDFGDVVVGRQTDAYLFFRGQNLSGTLSLRVYRGDTDAFTLSSSSIGAAAVNADDGYALKVTFKPTKTGRNSARLLVTDGGIEGSFGLDLIGYGHDVPTLSVLTATPATDITATSYTANWDAAPLGQDVDYYSVTRTRYPEATSEELEAETNALLIDDAEAGTRESYHVRSARLGYFSEASNEIWVDLQGGIADILADGAPLAVNLVEGGLRLATPIVHTNLRVVDAAGRLVTLLSTATQDTEIMLSAGVYMLYSDQAPQPLKVAIR